MNQETIKYCICLVLMATLLGMAIVEGDAITSMLYASVSIVVGAFASAPSKEKENV